MNEPDLLSQSMAGPMQSHCCEPSMTHGIQQRMRLSQNWVAQPAHWLKPTYMYNLEEWLVPDDFASHPVAR